jgi:hypothetical protein
MWCLWKIISEMEFVELGEVIKKEDLRSGLGSSTIVDFATKKTKAHFKQGSKEQGPMKSNIFIGQEL